MQVREIVRHGYDAMINVCFFLFFLVKMLVVRCDVCLQLFLFAFCGPLWNYVLLATSKAEQITVQSSIFKREGHEKTKEANQIIFLEEGT